MKSLVAAFCFVLFAAPVAAETVNVKVGVLRETHSPEKPSPFSIFRPPTIRSPGR